MLGWQVVADQAGEVSAGLLAHAVGQIIVEPILGVEADVGFVSAEVTQVEPVIGEGVDEAREARLAEQPFGLGAQYGGIAEFAVGGQLAQRCVRPAVREEV